MKLFVLALAGLVALAAGSSTIVERNAIAASIANPSPKYENRGDTIYHCNGDVWIMACPANGAACAITDMCLVKCIEDERGAKCSPQAPVALAKKGEDELEAEAKKSYECSNDHTGVLMCQYGFCSTDHYCKKGTKCSDRCACCQKTRIFSREAKPNALEKIPQDVAPLGIYESCKPRTDVAHNGRWEGV